MEDGDGRGSSAAESIEFFAARAPRAAASDANDRGRVQGQGCRTGRFRAGVVSVVDGAGPAVTRGVGAHVGPAPRGESLAASAEYSLGMVPERAAGGTTSGGRWYVALVSALASLPAEQRVAIVLHHLAPLPAAQVAEETGASVSAAEQQLVRVARRWPACWPVVRHLSAASAGWARAGLAA